MKKGLAVFLTIILFLSALAPASTAADRAQKSAFCCDETVFSDAYMLVSLKGDVHTVLAQKNAAKKKYPASLTKIVTAMVVLENTKDLGQKLKVQKSALEVLRNTGAQVAGLRVGQTVSIEQLLHLALVFSACDACQVLSEAVGGDTARFVEMMNAWASAVGCKNTHFVNPDGLHSKKQYSTAEDLNIITQQALKNADFVRISEVKTYQFGKTKYPHTNRMLHKSWKQYYYPYAKGIKTGYTKQAGRCLITTAEKNGMRYLLILLDAPLQIKKGKKINTVYVDAKTLFEWAFAHWSVRTLLEPTQAVGKLRVSDGKRDAVLLVPAAKVEALVPNDLERSLLSVKPIDLPALCRAPLAQGESICQAQLLYKGEVLSTFTMVVQSDVEFSVFKRVQRTWNEWMRKFF